MQSELLRVLRSLRLRLGIAMFLRHAARAALFFYGLLLALRAIVWWSGTSRPDFASLPLMLSWPLALGILGGLMVTLLRCPSLRDTAAILDARGDTRDRLASALEFSNRSNVTEMERMAVKESTAWLSGRDLRPLVPLKIPRELAWIVAPLAMLALLFWDEMARAAKQDQAIAEAEAAVRGTEQSLQEMARKAEERAAVTQDERLKKMAERLKQSAAVLRAEAEKAGDTESAALRELASLEQLVNQLRQPQAATPSELKAIAQALAKNAETREAAKSIDDNRLSDAADQLEKAANQPGAEQAEEALKEAIEHLARKQEQTSQQIEQLNEQAGEKQAGRGEMMKQLAKMLRQESGEKGAQQGAQQAQSKQLSDQDLKKLLSAIQQVKDQQQQQGEQPPGEGQKGEGNDPSKDGKKDGNGPVNMVDFGDGEPAGSLTVNIPSPNPVAEDDGSTTKEFLGAQGKAPAAPNRQEQLAGQLGEGESLSALVPSAANGDAKATRRYKQLTDAAAAAAADAVTQENIPLGARFLIKRYFDALRAKE